MVTRDPDLKTSIIYEVFPRIHSRDGNLEGIVRDLPRIRDLGADYLYLTPIHPIGEERRKGRYGSPYAVKDFRGLHPEYGDETSFRRLTEAAHSYGMRVLMDVVYHHTSPDSVLWQEHPEWFLKDSQGKPMNKVKDWTDIIDLDYNQKKLWDYQIETLQIWMDRGVDGFRCDVAPMVPLTFWKEARRRLSAGGPVWLAESGFMCFVKKDKDLGIVHHSDPELYGAFDMTYDSDGGEYYEKYLRGEARLSEYLHQIYLQEVLYPRNAIKLRLLENHDTPRVALRIPHRPSLRNWTAFNFLLPGSVLIYAGQELAIDGSESNIQGEESYHDLRRLVDWNSGDNIFELFTKNLIRIMKRIKTDCHACSVKEIAYGVVRMDWRDKGELHYVGLFNLEARCGELPAQNNLRGKDMLSGKPIDLSKPWSIFQEPVIFLCESWD